MDIEKLDFPDASFDAAACGHGLQFAADLSRALVEARRVLRSGARFAASIPVDGGNQRPWKVMDEVVDRWLPPAPKASDQESTRQTVNDAQALLQALATAGFVDADVEVIDEKVRWDSAEQLVLRCMSGLNLGSRLRENTASCTHALRTS